MHTLLLFVLSSPLLACSPTTMQTLGTTTSTVAPLRRKRNLDEVIVTVTTNKKYDEAQNQHHLKVADAMLEDIASSQGIHYDNDDIVREIRNEHGMFAVQYIIFGADCYGVRNFVSKAKNTTSHFVYATVDCEEGRYLL
ncbi:unnamed protein product [Cylicocyclus nassatus]|uniref:Uncharacterized protein n=1 Tax=Cylicocyclus nassatus TaxID=53992 RepID=A0AA36MC35_CYLNA|nr:unnamed protein product [Cylicocyclus nassatus]